MTLGGNICIRNGFHLDYCFDLAIRSLLPICDQISVSDSDSSDGTREFLDDWAKHEPKLKISNFPWTNPKGDIWFWVEWLNYARRQLETDFVVQLDADEVIHEACYHEVLEAARLGKALICERLNFWRDAQHLIPRGKCCGWEVIRVGPQNLWMGSDYPDARARQLNDMAVHSGVQLHHVGFLRERAAFFRKAKVVQSIWADDYDKRLDVADKAGGNWAAHPGVVEWVNELVPFRGSHPALLHQWLRDRGHTPNE